MAITLYHHPFSRAAGVLWALEEVGQPYELKFVDIMKGEHKRADYLRINPLGRVPAIEGVQPFVTLEGAVDALRTGHPATP